MGSVSESRIYAAAAWRIMPLLMAGWLFAYIDRVNISFARVQMGEQLGFSDAVFGLGAGLFFLGYFAFEVPSNLLLYKIGGRRWISRIMITWAIASAFTALVRTPTQFYVMRFMLGLAGWKWLLILEAIPSLIVGIAILRFLPDGIDTVKWLSPAEKEFAREQLT